MDEKKLRAERMFAKLRENIGKSITITSWNNGMYSRTSGILYDVYDFKGIDMGYGMPFVDNGFVIISIEVSWGETLYVQPLSEPCYPKNELEIIEVERKIFGDEYADQKLKEYEEKLRLEEIANRREQEYVAKFKETKAKEIIEKTLPYVADEAKEEFIKIVNKDSNGYYGITVISLSSEMLIAIGNGMDFGEAIHTIAGEKYGISTFAMAWTAAIISKCSSRGEEFRKYWNKSNGISEEEPGVVNPAILVIGSKKKKD